MVLAHSPRCSAAGERLVAAGAVTGAGAGLVFGLVVSASAQPFTLAVPDLLPLAGGLILRLDPLGAFFLILIGIGAIPAAIYGAGYSAIYEDGRASLRLLGVMLNLFLLTMSLVVLADNVLTFLLMWGDVMSLTSYFLIMTEADEPGTREAGLWYVAMTHIGLALLLAAFVLLMGSGSGMFADLRAGAPALSPTLRGVIFTLALLGFGSKAGIVPLHVWLPRAHPAAPSQISALMSGVMIKMGVYGLLRVGLDLLGGGPTWWGALMLALGALSAVLGILYALNHTTFKGLLFMGAGAVLHATHTRDMNRMGGLIKRMPWTALFFLVGAVAIAGLPPLNGFVSEWLLFQSLLPGVSLPQPLVAALMTLAVGMLALTSGLAAAGFVRRSASPSSRSRARRKRNMRMKRQARCCWGWGCWGCVARPWGWHHSPSYPN
jgi:hydrogenase-4 component B